MSARPPINPQLDGLLARTRQPDLPAGLAARIVAQTAGLPQQVRREDIVAEVPPTMIPLARRAANSNIWMRRSMMAGGLAAAAALAVIVAPSRFVHAPETRTVADAQPDTAPASSSVTPADQSLSEVSVAPADNAVAAPAHLARKADAAPSGKQTPPAPAELAESAAPDSSDAPLVVAPIQAPAAPEKLAEVEGPKAPVQGPPVPFDLLPSNSGTLGLGVAGSPEPAASPPPSNSPGRGGPGGPGGGFGRGGGGGGPHR